MNPNYLLDMPRMPMIISEDCNAPELRSRRHYEKGFRLSLRRSVLRAAASLASVALVIALAM